jgi:hypothetical protein
VDVDDGVLLLTRLSLGDLDAGSSALADLLDLGSLTTDDVCADRGGDGDIDRLLLGLASSEIGNSRERTFEPTSFAISLRV